MSAEAVSGVGVGLGVGALWGRSSDPLRPIHRLSGERGLRSCVVAVRSCRSCGRRSAVELHPSMTLANENC